MDLSLHHFGKPALKEAVLKIMTYPKSTATPKAMSVKIRAHKENLYPYISHTGTAGLSLLYETFTTVMDAPLALQPGAAAWSC